MSHRERKSANPTRGVSILSSPSSLSAATEESAKSAKESIVGGVVDGVERGAAEDTGAGTSSEAATGAKARKKRKKTSGEELVGAGGVRWPVHPTTVFIKGLGPDVTSEGLQEAFSVVGAVLEARVIVDKKTQAKKVEKVSACCAENNTVEGPD